MSQIQDPDRKARQVAYVVAIVCEHGACTLADVRRHVAGPDGNPRRTPRDLIEAALETAVGQGELHKQWVEETRGPSDHRVTAAVLRYAPGRHPKRAPVPVPSVRSVTRRASPRHETSIQEKLARLAGPIPAELVDAVVRIVRGAEAPGITTGDVRAILNDSAGAQYGRTIIRRALERGAVNGAITRFVHIDRSSNLGRHIPLWKGAGKSERAPEIPPGTPAGNSEESTETTSGGTPKAERQRQVRALLDRTPQGLTLQALCQQIGISPRRMRAALKPLIAGRDVCRRKQRSTGPGRAEYLYFSPRHRAAAGRSRHRAQGRQVAGGAR